MKKKSISKKFISKDLLENVRSQNRFKTIVFCSGCFDMFHAGHAVLINQCASLGDVLVVGVGRDSTVREKKGAGRPINHENNRLYLVSNIAAVDYALLTDELVENSDVREILKELKPDIFAFTEQDTEAIEADRRTCQNLGIEIVTVPRTVPAGLTLSSTTEITEKIILL